MIDIQAYSNQLAVGRFQATPNCCAEVAVVVPKEATGRTTAAASAQPEISGGTQ